MEKQLLELLFDYSVSDKKIDGDYIEKLIDIYVTTNVLEKYVLKYEIIRSDNNRNKNYLASYNPYDKTIKIYGEEIDRLFNSSKKYEMDFNDLEKCFYQNVIFTQIILHELEHANQRRIMAHENGLEAEILTLSFIRVKEVNKLISLGYNDYQIIKLMLGDIEEVRELYELNYDIAPQERLAEIKSHLLMIDILNGIGGFLPNLILMEEAHVLKNMLKGYNQYSSPSIRFIKQIGNGNALQLFDWYDNDSEKCLSLLREKYSLYERLKYGLMISKQEKSISLEKLKSTNKYMS